MLYPCKRHPHQIKLKIHLDEKEVFIIINNTFILALWIHDYELQYWNLFSVLSSTLIGEWKPPKMIQAHGEPGEEKYRCKHWRIKAHAEKNPTEIGCFMGESDGKQLKVTVALVRHRDDGETWRRADTHTHTALCCFSVWLLSSHPALLPWPDKNERRVQKQAIKQAPKLIIFPAWCWIPILSLLIIQCVF